MLNRFKKLFEAKAKSEEPEIFKGNQFLRLLHQRDKSSKFIV